MRSVHSLDQKHLAFSDAFGLTRLSAPGKIKTERKITGGLDASLSTNPARSEILAWRQNWDSMHHLAFPALKSLTKIDRFRLSTAVLTPTGEFATLESRYSDAGHVPVLQRWTTVATRGGTLDLRDARLCKGVSVADGSGPVWTRLASSPAGVWAVVQGAEPMLYVGDFAGDVGTTRWRVPVALPREAFVTVHPFDDGRVCVAAFLPSRRESVIVRLTAEGDVVGIDALATRTPAVPVTPDDVLHQLSEETVGRTPLGGGACRTTGIARDDQGVGRLFGEGASGWFLPWHAESLLDLRTADAVSRKLSDDDAGVRRFFREQVARINALANPAGILVELCSLDANPARRDYGFSWSATPGNGSLRGVLAAGTVNALTDDDALQNLDGWRWNVGGGISVAFDHARWDEAEVDGALGALEDAGVPLFEAMKSIGDAYSFGHGVPQPQRAPFARAGARRFLAALCWSVTHGGVTGLRAGAREFFEGLTPAKVAEAVRALPEARAPRVGYHALETLCIIAIDALRAEVAPVIAAASHASDGWQNGVGLNFERGVQWLGAEVPDRASLAATLLRDARQPSNVASYVTRALG